MSFFRHNYGSIKRRGHPLAWLLVVTGALFLSCRPGRSIGQFGNMEISAVITAMTEIMLHDITNPPLCARFFSYATLAGYEVVSENDDKFRRLHGILNGYPQIKKPDSTGASAYPLAALLAMMETAKKMQPSGRMMNSFEERFIDSCRNAGVGDNVLTNSKKYAVAISDQILAYARNDGYREISNLPRYTPLPGAGHWYPTPPAFISAVEPYFNIIRPFTLDSAGQFRPAPPVPFDPAAGSAFYRLMKAVYDEGGTAMQEHRAIASFWDCNPFAVQDGGHLQFGFKKISPGSHWLGITGIACLEGHKSFGESMQIFMSVSVGLMDAFICCWDEKFRSNRIRPETAIRKYIDPRWQPLLQTPPFPEYLSGHSVISAAAAVILTHYFGEYFHYTDTVEVGYGLPGRSFGSFQQAAAEAGVSRFYGGIHFMDGIEQGQAQGLKAGEWVIKKLNAGTGAASAMAGSNIVNPAESLPLNKDLDNVVP